MEIYLSFSTKLNRSGSNTINQNYKQQTINLFDICVKNCYEKDIED